MEMTTIKANKRLRARILELCDASKASGGLRGRMIMDVLTDFPEAPEDDRALMGLLQDLVNIGEITERDIRKYKHERRSLDTLVYCVTAQGTARLQKQLPPHPLIEDDRISPPELTPG